MIDPHVHLRDWNQKEKETLRHGLSTAAAAGFTHLFDMPNTDPPLTGKEVILKRLQEAQTICTEIAVAAGRDIAYSLYGGLTDNQSQVRDMMNLAIELHPRIAGLKLFTVHSTGNMGLIDSARRRMVYETAVETGYQGIIAVHCEKDELLKPEVWNPNEPVSHSAARPPEAEYESVREQIAMAGDCGFSGNLHICHISTPESLIIIEKARKTGLPFTISCGITPHHTLLDTDAYTELPGNFLKVNPPLRDPSSRTYMYQALLDGRIDWIESDHAPHTVQNKQDGASGIPGFAGYLMLVNRLVHDGMDPIHVERLSGGRVAEVFGLQINDSEIPFVHKVGQTLADLITTTSASYPTDPYGILVLEN